MRVRVGVRVRVRASVRVGVRVRVRASVRVRMGARTMTKSLLLTKALK